MRRYMILLALLPILIVFNISIYQKEKVRKEGELILLELAPVDPRSLMQGDFMRLSYKIARDASEELKQDRKANRNVEEKLKSGHIVLAIDKKHQGRFVRFYSDDTPPARNERLLPFKLNEKSFALPVSIHPDSFFFEEGQGKIYQTARFGMIHMADDGSYILVGLADEMGNRINGE